MSTFFISDVHLDASRPDITQIFLNFLQNDAPKADAVYILGDLFEAWIGDDEQTPLHQTVVQALHTVTQAGIPVYLMHGNRDFLLRQEFARQSGCQFLPDPTVINLYNQPTLLMHGDTLCTDDKAYLKYRHYVRKPFFQWLFLRLPLSWRKAVAGRLRNASYQHVSTLDTQVMDVVTDEVLRVMAAYQAKQLIHGHTHQPAIRYFWLNGQKFRHIVLSDWDIGGNVLIYSKEGEVRLAGLQGVNHYGTL